MIAAPLNPWVRRAGAGLGLLGLLVGLPVTLALLVGWPFPRALPDADTVSGMLEGRTPVDPMAVLKALAIVCWLSWAEIVACAVVEVRAAALGKAAVRVPLAGPLQPLVAKLVAATIVGVLVFGARGVSSAPASERRAESLLLAPVDLVSQVETLTSDARDKVVNPPIERHVEQITVQPRDNLWDLAEEHLGDPLRWREIFELNHLRVQPDGRMLVDPELIQPGWFLDLPARKAMPVTGEPEVCEIAPAAPSPAPEASDLADADDEHGEVSDDQGSGSLLTDPEPLEESDDPEPGPAGPSVPLPGGSVVSLAVASAVAAALTTIRLKRRRRYRPSPPAPARWAPSDQPAPATRRLVRQIAEASGNDLKPENDVVPFAFRGLHEGEHRGLVVGERNQEAVHLDLARLSGLSLSGEGAESVLRSIVVTALSKGCPAVQEVLMSKAAAEQLLPGVEEFDGLRIVPGVEQTLEIAEVELLRRRRLLQETGTSDVGTLREQTGEPAAELMVVLDGREAHDPARMKTVSGLGGSAGISLVVLGECSSCESKVHVEPDGRISDVAPPDLADHLDGVRLHRMTASECVEVLGVFAAATTDDEDDEMGSAVPAVGSSDVKWQQPAKPSEAALVPDSGSLVKVRLFGPYRIEVAGEEVRKGLRSSARELLAYYLLHPEGARAEAAIDALWPDADLSRGQERFWTALGNLRSTIRKLLPGEHQLIEKRGGIYAVEPKVFEVDVWSFQESLADAQSCAGAEGEIDALREAVDCQEGELVEGSYYEWAEPLREELRRKGLDTCVRLAQLLEDRGDRETALEVVEQGIQLDPYAESLYQQALRLANEMGRPEVLRQLFRQLSDRLAEIDADTSDRSRRLAVATSGYAVWGSGGDL